MHARSLQVIMLYQWMCIYTYHWLILSICVLMYYEFLVLLGIFLVYFHFLACLLTIFTPSMLQRSIIWGKLYFCLSYVNSKPYWHVTYSSLSGLCLTFTGLELLFVVMFVGILSVVMQLGLLWHAICSQLAALLCWVGLTWLFSSPITIRCITMSHMCH